MNNSGRAVSPIITTVAVGAVTLSFIAISMIGPQRSKAQGQYGSPVIFNPVQSPVFNPVNTPFINPITNPLDVTKVIPGQEGNVNNAIAALGANTGGPATLGISQPKDFPSTEQLKGNSDFILVQPETGTTMERESPYLVMLREGTVLAAVKRPSQLGMVNTPIGEVSFASQSDAFISYVNGLLRVRNIDGMRQTLKVKVTSGPLAGKIFSVAPGYELVIGDHKLGRNELRPSDGILRRASQTFDNGCAGVSQYHVHNALASSGVVSHLAAKGASDEMSRKVIGDMSRMAAVLNQVQGAAGYGP